MSDTKSRLAEIKSRLSKVYQGEWICSANIPFNIDMRKPRPSLSKHDDKRPTYWHMDDGLFVLYARQDIEFLLQLIEEMQNEKE